MSDREVPRMGRGRRYAPAIVGLALAAMSLGLAVPATPAIAAGCVNEQLRIEDHSTALPECRAYEQVSPAGKSGGVGDVENFEATNQTPALMQSALGGEGAVVYTGEDFYRALTGGAASYVTHRTPAGWGAANTTNLTPAGVNGQFQVVSVAPSLEGRYVTASTLAPRQASYRNLFLEGGGLPRQALITLTPPHRNEEEFGYSREPNTLVSNPIPFAPASADLSRVFFEVNDSLLAGAGALEKELSQDAQSEVEKGQDGNYIYEWHGGGLSLVDVLPDGTVARHAAIGHNYAGRNGGEAVPDLDHAVSADGSRVFWTAGETGNLYLHQAGALDSTLVAAGGEFLSAKADGSRVFYAKGGTAKVEGVEGAELQLGDLYEYDVETEVTRDLSGGEVRGFLGASADGETVYFVAREELTTAANGQGAKAVAGGDNVFVSEPDPAHAGQHVTRFVATLAALDNNPQNFPLENGPVPTGMADWAPTVALRQAEVSPNGRFLAFGSHENLTKVAVPNTGPEIFEYDAVSEDVSCASCAPSGEPNGGALIFPSMDGYGLKLQRYVLDDGGLFFTTTSGLVPQDRNGQRDVYEFVGGVPHLISGAFGEGEAVFLDASEDGRDVFFTTPQPLVGQDQDGIVDVYDARVDGGFAAPVSGTECGSTGGCHGYPGTPPALPSPGGSATFSGAGNLAPPPPPPGSVKPKPETRAQKLAKALKACRRDRSKKRRAACERGARKRYGAARAGRARRAATNGRAR